MGGEALMFLSSFASTMLSTGGSICNENRPINPKVLYLHAL